MVTPNTMALLKQHLAITGGQVRPCPTAQQFHVRLTQLGWVGNKQLTGVMARGSMGCSVGLPGRHVKEGESLLLKDSGVPFASSGTDTLPS